MESFELFRGGVSAAFRFDENEYSGVKKVADKVKNDIVIHIKEDRSDAIESLDALMLAKYLDRIGAHAVNICEWEIFRETGTIQDTNVF